MRGKLVVIEGIDGSGKSTQVKLLFNYLKQEKTKVKLMNFPRYDQFYGDLCGRMLKGEFGGIKLSPYLTSLPYAMDRLMARDEINKWLEKGYLVLMDRYTTSSLVHQGAKFSGKKQDKFIEWLLKMEYEVNKMPKEELVIFLDVSVKFSQKLMKSRGSKVYVKGVDVRYQEETFGLYKKLVEKYEHWKKIECVRGERLLDKKKIHEKICQLT